LSQIRIRLTDEILEKIVGAVSQRTGNVIGQKQINMIESRLTKRVITLGLKDPESYLDYFSRNRDTEIEELISLLTVHHTYFFREFGQFEFLGAEVLPTLIEKMKVEGRNTIRVWSAACSRGHESYSLFMFIDQYLKSHAPSFKVEILGTDVDRDSVKIAANGVYSWDEVKEIPMNYISPYWVRGSGEIAKFAKIKEAARKACVFKQGNLMETSGFAAYGQFDIIFCRNVFIYFQADDVSRIAQSIATQLKNGGYFFVGLSESLSSVPTGLKRRGPSIYGPEAVIQKAKTAVVPAASKTIRVVCVDDSAVILKLLKAVLTTDAGFEIVGTATNGQEAAQLVESGLQFDVMTLDVHMPVMTGVEYLQNKLTANHPPVVMLTSASRDNLDLAQKAMELGARDYIEKPSLGDLKARTDEIRSKLRFVSDRRSPPVAVKKSLDFEKNFKNSLEIRNTKNKVNVVFVDDSKLSDLMTLLLDTKFPGLPCVVVALGEIQSRNKVLERMKTNLGLAAKLSSPIASGSPDHIACVSFADFRKLYDSRFRGHVICYSVLANVSRTSWQDSPKSTPMQILLSEDLDRGVFLSHLSQVCVTPVTSFSYMAGEFFGKTDLKTAA